MTFDPINKVSYKELNPPLQQLIDSKASKDELQNEADLRAAADNALALVINNNATNMGGSGGSIINKHIIVRHGELIPLPDGCTEAQCQWGVEGAVPRSALYGSGVYYTPNVLSVPATSRIVTAQYRWFAGGQNNHDITANGSVYCWISGTKPYTPDDTIPKAIAKEIQDRIAGDKDIWSKVNTLVNDNTAIINRIVALEARPIYNDPCAGNCTHACTGKCGGCSSVCSSNCSSECSSGCSSR